MLESAAIAGTTDLVATPHADLCYVFDSAVNALRLQELQELIRGRLRLYLGCDFHLTFQNVQDALQHRSKYTINYGQYLLVELPDRVSAASTSEILQQLLQAGLQPVITHPERNTTLQRQPAQLDSWIEFGCLTQVTAQSLTGQFGRSAKELAGRLIDGGKAHFLASDAHDPEVRHARLDEAYQLVSREWGESRAHALLIQNPGAALANLPLPALTPRPARRWYHFWR